MVTFDEKSVVVTGGGRGIGKETCELLGQRGAKVVVNDIGGDKTGEGSQQRPADAVVETIEEAGGTAVADYSDVGTVEGASRAVETAIEEFGRLDCVYNNAGILRENSLVNMTEEEWDEVIRVHLKGMWAVLQQAAQHWREQHKDGVERESAIVNASSDVSAGAFSRQGSAFGLGNYAAAKAGILGLTRSAAEELGRYGVRVNAIWPAAATRLTETLPMEVPEPEPVAHLVGYLLGESCDITGQTVRIGGDRIDLVSPAPQVKATAFSGGDAWTVDELGDRFDGTLGTAIENPFTDEE
jgi:NAD(P)-dependent dehydrogenase (short-subunit alcohol dehydrogenase family)